MAFWSNASLEPLRQYRWTVVFGASTVNGLDSQVYALKKVQRPKIKIEEITHRYMNHSFYYPGRANWEALTATFAAVPEGHTNGVGTTASLMKTLVDAGYRLPTGNDKAAQFVTPSKAGFGSGLGASITIKQLGADGNPIEGFQLWNPFFTNIEFGELDYGSEEVVDISVTIRYDYAQILTGANLTVTVDQKVS
jgi:hypothetical protein